jgi:hypothetical protein
MFYWFATGWTAQNWNTNILLAILFCNSKKMKQRENSGRRVRKSANGPTDNEICNEIRKNARTKKEIGIEPVYEVLLMR